MIGTIFGTAEAPEFVELVARITALVRRFARSGSAMCTSPKSKGDTLEQWIMDN
jgi:hypothetical protein